MYTYIYKYGNMSADNYFWMCLVMPEPQLRDSNVYDSGRKK